MGLLMRVTAGSNGMTVATPGSFHGRSEDIVAMALAARPVVSHVYILKTFQVGGSHIIATTAIIRSGRVMMAAEASREVVIGAHGHIYVPHSDIARRRPWPSRFTATAAEAAAAAEAATAHLGHGNPGKQDHGQYREKRQDLR